MIKKEMIYFYDEEAFTQPRELLAEGEIDGYEYIIISCGLYPMVYVKLGKASAIQELALLRNEFYVLDNIHDFHGGVTSVTEYLDAGEREFRVGNYIGWRYNTDNDFIAGKYFENHANGKKWTTAELVEEAKAAVKAIKDYENAENS